MAVRRSSGDKAQDFVDRTIDTYQKIAKVYTETWFNDPVMEPGLGRFLSMLEPGSSILDAGCGPGRDTRFMKKKGFEVVGIDLSDAMLEEARLRVPEGIFRRMDIRAPRFPPETFDGIWAAASLHHVPSADVLNVMRRYKGLLVPGGTLAIVVQEGNGDGVDSSGRYRKFYDRNELKNLLADNGFEVVYEQASSSNKNTLGGDRQRIWLFCLAQKSTLGSSSEPSASRDCLLCPGSRFSLRRRAGLAAATAVLWG